jgi:hypothetical protein
MQIGFPKELVVVECSIFLPIVTLISGIISLLNGLRIVLYCGIKIINTH